MNVTFQFDEISTSTTELNNEYVYELSGHQSGFFGTIHTAAVCATSLSVLCSFSVVVMFIRKLMSGKTRLFERLLLYLSINDLLFSSFHGSDHAIILFTGKYPPRGVCIMFAFVLIFTLSMVSICSSLVSVATALAIVRQGMVSFGPKDCYFFMLNILPPLIVSVVGLLNNWYGPSGAW